MESFFLFSFWLRLFCQLCVCPDDPDARVDGSARCPWQLPLSLSERRRTALDIFVISYLATDRPTDGSGTYVRACVVVPAGALDALAPGCNDDAATCARRCGRWRHPPRAWAREHEHRHRQIRIIRLAGRAREAGTRSAAADTRHWAGRGAATCAASLPCNKRPRRNPMRILWWIHATRRDATRISGRCWTLDGGQEEPLRRRPPAHCAHTRAAGRCRWVVPWPPLPCTVDATRTGRVIIRPTHPPVGCTVPPETAIKIRQHAAAGAHRM